MSFDIASSFYCDMCTRMVRDETYQQRKLRDIRRCKLVVLFMLLDWRERVVSEIWSGKDPRRNPEIMEFLEIIQEDDELFEAVGAPKERILEWWNNIISGKEAMRPLVLHDASVYYHRVFDF